MGLLNFFLGLEINQNESGVEVAQSKYARDLLARFHMSDCKPTSTPFLSGVKLEDDQDTPLVDCTLYCQLVGSLLYVTHFRPDLSYVVGVVSRYMQKPYELHWKVAKRILHYVQGTISYGIHYSVGCTLDLIGYTDSDWAGYSIDRKSTSGYVLSLGFGPICWSSKKQSSIALSSAEVEY
ncbi:secreted RxLR effector protein 161-like [Cryptomeria japonica]|uniref:secreted RxLR effector protein 161-like n=1 Tax=Cryptomeria japonica TaxID=3369 RepID=UPI0027DA61A6|nr:secreted RxLR effector protein 161-like [Cryptomeria japonica]